ncbi:MAG: FeoB-associated Cys-rich membrane protein [Oscillospiraceae bacterium]|jgi:hypothetical protein|nr:FeoB-associated Cys-rich membrane protein [Oscillospiraceae bacterium]
MLQFIIENLATIIIGALVAALFVYCVVKLVRERKGGDCSACGCNCASCPNSAGCHSPPKK